MIKKTFLCLLVFLLTIAFPYGASAAEYPWTALEGYQSAVAEGDDRAVVAYGQEILAFYGDTEDGDPTKIAVCAPILDQMGKSYEVIGNTTEAARMWRAYIPMARVMGWDDGIAYAVAKIRALERRLKLFIAVEPSGNPYYGAKYEPVSGVLFGKTLDSYPMFTQDKQNSAVLSYSIYGREPFFIPGVNTPGRLLSDEELLLIAWNMPNDDPGAIYGVTGDDDYILEMARILAAYGKPVLLRFAGEMNVWEPLPDPEVYKQAFIKTAEIMRANAPNVAMLWSPTDIAGIYTDTDAYYPGDEYVDWVGVSSYNPKYFLGVKDWGDPLLTESNNAVFMTGEYADPLGRLSDTVAAYGDRKPIIISEGGAAYYTVPLDEWHIDWAVYQLKTLYAYLPMFYPGVKGILHFDKVMDETSRYELYTQPEMMAAYNECVSGASYISAISQAADVAYMELTGGSLTGVAYIYAYAGLSGAENGLSVAYYIDGGLVYQSEVLPFEFALDTALYEAGAHVLEVKAFTDGKPLDAIQVEIIF